MTIFENLPLLVAVLAWAEAQLIKFFLYLFKKKRVDFRLFWSSGGMPSSHSSFVTAATTAIAVKEGLASSSFAVATVVSLVVMYDAAGVRRAAGKQAAALNLLFASLEDSGVKLDKKLKELLGHTPVEVVAGAVLGVATALLFIH